MRSPQKDGKTQLCACVCVCAGANCVAFLAAIPCTPLSPGSLLKRDSCAKCMNAGEGGSFWTRME